MLRTCHFVYAGQPDNGEIRSPYTITRNLYQFLKTKFETVHYYDWQHTGGLAPVSDGDVILGHPNYPNNTPVWRLFADSWDKRALRFTIHPLHTRFAADNLPFAPLVEQAHQLFAICGQYWYDTLPQTPFASWQPKITRVDMAVDSRHYPYLKESFNPPGRRRLLYVGSTTPNKNLEMLVDIMRRMPDVRLDWYGGSSDHTLAQLPNVSTIGHVELNIDRGRQICHDCDIFVSTSVSDANPTTLTEAAAWGIIVAATRESGYYGGAEKLNFCEELEINNVDESVRRLRYLLSLPSEELQARSRLRRTLIESHYNWDVFCNTIWTKISNLLPLIGC